MKLSLSHEKEGHSDTWMNLEGFMLRERNQAYKDSYCTILLICSMHGACKFTEGGAEVVGSCELLFGGYRSSVWDNERVVGVYGGGGCAWCR